jgi:hypothetical protein
MQDVSIRSNGILAKHGFEGLRRLLSPHRIWLIAGVVVGLLAGLMLLLHGDDPAPAINPPARHPAAVTHAPSFITPQGSSDVLLIAMAIVLVAAVLAIGVLFFWLHSLPERLVHKSTKVHFDIVAVLALLSLFTHVHLFWVAALLLALVKMPDLSFPYLSGLLHRITVSLERIADAQPHGREESSSKHVGTAADDERKPC